MVIYIDQRVLISVATLGKQEFSQVEGETLDDVRKKSHKDLFQMTKIQKTVSLNTSFITYLYS